MLGCGYAARFGSRIERGRAGHDTLAFAAPAAIGALGVGWMVMLIARGRLR